MSTDPFQADACASGLRYAIEQSPGIQRQKAGETFLYLGAQGAQVRDEATLARIKALVIPPAWSEVWISPIDNDHIQATGRDARGRKQYRYHQRWQAARDATKYGRQIEFERVLPLIRRQVRGDLARRDLSRERVLAAAVQLLELTMIRVGNEEYAKENESFGLTTLQKRHLKIKGVQIQLRFRGKSGKDHELLVKDRQLAVVIQRCQDLPGRQLFQYVDESGWLRPVTSSDVNDYIRAASGDDFTAKDFRTWAGTVLAARALQELAPPASARQAEKNVVAAVEKVAQRLGNTRAVCRQCYVHPAILDSYLAEALPTA